ncbi:ANTAR domain-containing protein [Streptomyces sp. NBC_00519]|uniref:ANTAR domain-containing protein n=1 Tax=Streptomyces sp. NBC_00519 TaxID=2975764 RepID=UPI0030E42310
MTAPGPAPGPGATGDEPEREELERLRAQVRDLRAKARAYPQISHAQGILQERYGLPDADSAFALLQQASQRLNVKMRILSGAVATVPRPDPGEQLWFPQRVRLPEPALRFEADRPPEPGNRGAVLGAVLSQTLAVVGTDMGNVQVADRARRGLVIEKHTGLTADFVDFFAYVGPTGTACAKAARDGTQVTVRDVESDPVFDEPSRAAILAAGSRACHSVPLTTAAGLCVGMVSAHSEHTLQGLTRAQLKVLDVVGGDGGRWLAWHDRTVVLDALEYLHALGRRMRGTRMRRA